VHVPAPEVDQLAGRVDLGLVGGLRLAEHRRGVERLPPRPGQQVGGAQEHRGPVVERQVAPRRGGGLGAGHRLLGVGVRGVRGGAEDGGVPVRLDDVEALAPAHPLLVADGHGELERLTGQLGEALLQRGPLRGARGVGEDRLVARRGDVGDGVHGTSLHLVLTRERRKKRRFAGRSASRRMK
jgi:hypothetical protein